MSRSAQHCLFSDFATSVYTDFNATSYSSALKMLSQRTLLGGFSDLVIPCRPTWSCTSKERDLNFTIEVETHMVMETKCVKESLCDESTLNSIKCCFLFYVCLRLYICLPHIYL